jgi:hypothetical protein
MDSLPVRLFRGCSLFDGPEPPGAVRRLSDSHFTMGVEEKAIQNLWPAELKSIGDCV